jgi:crossover junction endodeoxyribonuclease RuvC
MTLRLTMGCDPGQTGCIALLADGEPAGFIDMPTMPRAAGGHEINAAALAASLRGALQAHPGAAVLAVCELVGSMPKQGLASTFRFGQSDGIMRGVLGALGIGYFTVSPVKWKNYYGLKGQPKDAARSLAIRRFPSVSGELARKKDGGRADALLLALWAETTEQAARAA